MLLTIDEPGSKSLETVFSIAICRQSGDKWQWETLFLTIFDLRSSIVVKFLIAVYWCKRLTQESYNSLKIIKRYHIACILNALDVESISKNENIEII